MVMNWKIEKYDNGDNVNNRNDDGDNNNTDDDGIYIINATNEY